MALSGQSSQGQTGTRPRDKRDKMATLLWNLTGNGRFVPRTGPSLCLGRVPFVPGKVPVCPGHRPVPHEMFMFIGFFRSLRNDNKMF